MQRLREQIKTWQSSNDIKDKKPLLEARKNIEQVSVRRSTCSQFAIDHTIVVLLRSKNKSKWKGSK